MTENENDWTELHREFSKNWHFRTSMVWRTVQLETTLSSALASLAAYSIIYLYTSESFWKTDILTSCDRFLVRTALIFLPVSLLVVNIMLYHNYDRQCRRMYEVCSIKIKIEDEMNLYRNRSSPEHFPCDKWLVPNRWKNLDDCTSKDFVNNMMKEKDGLYKNMLWLFRAFGLIAVVLIVFEIALLAIHPY